MSDQNTSGKPEYKTSTKLRNVYISLFPEKLNIFHESKNVLEVDSDNEASLQKLYTLLHNTKGSSKGYGFPLFGAVVAELSEHLRYFFTNSESLPKECHDCHYANVLLEQTGLRKS